jgi:predicted DNA repair protein MutK
MSGLLALLDDVAGIAKIAAASVDDVAGQAVKAGAKAAGAVIDDAAVTPKYVNGFSAAREVPIVMKIARGSLFNKLVILLPVALLLSAFAPWAIAPLLMLGGAYLCFEGAEKVWHAIAADHGNDPHLVTTADGAGLEEERVKGAIKTDFILSAEIMTIALASIPAGDSIWMKALILFIVAVGITVAVYGFVALIVKADDVGLHLSERGGPLAWLGRGIVRFMPPFMKVLTVVGTAAMIWVGGQIVIHGMHELGQHQPYEWIKHMAEAAALAVPQAAGLVNWAVTAFFDGVFGLVLGLILIPVATRVVGPLIAAVKGMFGAKA